MTSKTLLLLAAIICSTFSFAQQTNNSTTAIPAQVSQSLMTIYPKAKNITWDMAMGYYVPSFKDDNTDTKALIDLKGQMIQTETKLATAKIPQTAKDYISQHYTGTPIKDAGVVTAGNRATRLRVSVGTKTLVFDNNGAFMHEAPTPVIY